MKASELIKKLQELQEEFGDLEVKVDSSYSDEAQDIDFLFLDADVKDADVKELEYWFSISY